MAQDFLQLLVRCRLEPLVVPVDGFELLHDRDDGAMPVDRCRAQLFGTFVEGRTAFGHSSPFYSDVSDHGCRRTRTTSTHEPGPGSVVPRATTSRYFPRRPGGRNEPLGREKCANFAPGSRV